VTKHHWKLLLWIAPFPLSYPNAALSHIYKKNYGFEIGYVLVGIQYFACGHNPWGAFLVDFTAWLLVNGATLFNTL
jgi:hypothetical protein